MPCHEKAWKFKCSLLQNKEPFQTKNKYKKKNKSAAAVIPRESRKSEQSIVP